MALPSLFSKIEVGWDNQPKCESCRRVEALLKLWEGRQTRNPRLSATKRLLFHGSYDELDDCAVKCATCRIIRRAIILNQPTSHHVSRLSDLQRPRGTQNVPRIWATAAQGPVLGIFLGEEAPGASVSHRAGPDTTILSLRPTGASSSETSLSSSILSFRPYDQGVYDQIKHWAQVCHTDHADCANLAWSTRSPSRLIHIQPDGGKTVQLISPAAFIPYVALSYCWGPPSSSSLPSPAGSLLPDPRTLTTNLSSRLHTPFPVSCLPATIRDAIAITRGVGLSHIWIDALCIVQDCPRDWSREAARMHEVYANAWFTLCAASVDCAGGPSSSSSSSFSLLRPTPRPSASNNEDEDDDHDHENVGRLLQPREAWRYRVEHPPCRLNGRELELLPPPPPSRLRDALAASAWSRRAWTMQEDMLSSRAVYWTPHGAFWSCGTECWGEVGPTAAVEAERRRRRMGGVRETASSGCGDDDAAAAGLRGIGIMKTTTTTMTATTAMTHQQQRRTVAAAEAASRFRRVDPPVLREFLTACRSGGGGGATQRSLHDIWLGEIVESYSRRLLTRQTDRYAALSGLATRYWEYCRRSRSEGHLGRSSDSGCGDGDGDGEEEYLAGLWRSTVATDLGWMVDKCVVDDDYDDVDGLDGNVVEGRRGIQTGGRTPESPSWSWVTLPAGVAVQVLPEKDVLDKSSRLWLLGRAFWREEDEEIADLVTRGSRVKSLTVHGRMRSLCNVLSVPVPWTAVCTDSSKFSFGHVVDMYVHAIDLETGCLVHYEPHAEETVAQIDSLSKDTSVYHDPSSVQCLEIRPGVMLLLVPAETEKRADYVTYERIGVSTCFRTGFFSCSLSTNVKLI